jgi:hypothetical protein
MRAGILILVLLGFGVAGAAASPDSGSKTIGTRGSVLSISADGPRVAIRAQLGGDPKKTCQSAAVWTPVNGSVVHLGGTDCFDPGENASRHDSLTLAGTRAVWVDYDYGNHAYCDGPFMATLAAPKAVRIPSDCDGTTADEYYGFEGDGALVAMTSFDVCEADGECTDDNGEPLPAGVYQVTVSRLVGATPKLILAAEAHRALLDANGGRLLVWEPDPGSMVVYSAAGKQLASFPTGKSEAEYGWLDGDLVVYARGATLRIDSISGAAEKRRTMARGGKLRDVDGGLAVYSVAGAIHVLRLSDGRDRVAAKTTKLVDAQLEPAGLFYADNSGRGPKPGRVTFVPRSRI